MTMAHGTRFAYLLAVFVTYLHGTHSIPDQSDDSSMTEQEDNRNQWSLPLFPGFVRGRGHGSTFGNWGQAAIEGIDQRLLKRIQEIIQEFDPSPNDKCVRKIMQEMVEKHGQESHLFDYLISLIGGDLADISERYYDCVKKERGDGSNNDGGSGSDDHDDGSGHADGSDNNDDGSKHRGTSSDKNGGGIGNAGGSDDNGEGSNHGGGSGYDKNGDGIGHAGGSDDNGDGIGHAGGSDNNGIVSGHAGGSDENDDGTKHRGGSSDNNGNGSKHRDGSGYDKNGNGSGHAGGSDNNGGGSGHAGGSDNNDKAGDRNEKGEGSSDSGKSKVGEIIRWVDENGSSGNKSDDFVLPGFEPVPGNLDLNIIKFIIALSKFLGTDLSAYSTTVKNELDVICSGERDSNSCKIYAFNNPQVYARLIRPIISGYISDGGDCSKLSFPLDAQITKSG